MRKFYYAWLHIPTGKKGTESQEFNSQLEFLQELDKWNRLGQSTWKYWRSV